MMAYILMAFVSIFLAALYHFSDKKSKIARFLLFCSFTSLFIFSAIRYNVYTDYEYTYVPAYYRIAEGLGETHYEPLFLLLNKLVYLIFNNVDWLFIITSFIFIYFVGKTLKSKSACIPLSIFLFIFGRMYFYSFDQIRQYIAISIFLYNIKNISEKKFLPYTLLTIIGGLNHKLALIYLPVYFLNKVKLNRKQYIVITILILALAPFYISIFDHIGRYFYADYFTYASLINGTRINNSIVFIIMVIINVVLSFIYFNKLNNDKYYRIILYLQLVLLFITLGTWNLFDSYRIIALFLYTSVLLIPKIIEVEKNKKMRMLLLMCICSIYLISGYTFVKNASINHPYKTIFNK